MTDHITAAELRVVAGNWRVQGNHYEADRLDRAAAALDAKDARIAELMKAIGAYQLPRDAYAEERERQHAADAELGALVRKIREHPERSTGGLYVSWSGTCMIYSAHADVLARLLRDLDLRADAKAASREAERGVEGPSGRRYQVRDGWVERWRVDTGGWVGIALAADIPTVAALIERHGGNDAN